MSKIKVLIADDNILTAQMLHDKLSEQREFEMLEYATNGIEAIELIEKEKPDVVLLDIIMPKLDGIGVLEHTQSISSSDKPVFIVYSAISHENYITRAMKLGADYYMIKPFDETVMAARIKQLHNVDYKNRINTDKIFCKPKKNKNKYDDELMVLATKYMREYGLRAHMTGYSYIRDIITHSFDYYCGNGCLPKGIYREIAIFNGVTVQKVERAIRNCIENVLQNNPLEKKPTNSQVICQLIEKIRLNN